MSFLTDALNSLKGAAARAWTFADPSQHIAEAEHEFKAAMVKAHDELAARVAAIEGHPALSIPPIESAPAPGEPPAPPSDDAFVAPGFKRISDGEIQTEASLEAAQKAWVEKHQTAVA